MVRIIFACVENSCRSQMAEGFARHWGSDSLRVSSGGPDPSSKIDENALKVMKEREVDISSQKPSKIDPDEVMEADLVVTMGCGSEVCPAPTGGENIEWDIEDPSGESVEKFREVRDEIEHRVKRLLDDKSTTIKGLKYC